MKANSAATERAIERLFALPVKHRTRRIEGSLYAVISGRSGNEYMINVDTDFCSCVARDFGKRCDHIVAAKTLSQAIQQQQHQHTSAESTPRVVAETRYERGGQRVVVHTCNGWEV